MPIRTTYTRARANLAVLFYEPSCRCPQCFQDAALRNLGQFMVSRSVRQLQPLDETLDVTP